MRIVYDQTKSDRNVRERGLPFDRASEFDFDSAAIGFMKEMVNGAGSHWVIWTTDCTYFAIPGMVTSYV